MEAWQANACILHQTQRRSSTASLSQSKRLRTQRKGYTRRKQHPVRVLSTASSSQTKGLKLHTQANHKCAFGADVVIPEMANPLNPTARTRKEMATPRV